MIGKPANGDHGADVIKVIVMIRKRPDITTEQFRHHYETVHAPLVDELLPYYATYRRNYVDGPVRGRSEPECDVFTELEFATASHYEGWLAALARPDVLARIRADEANFLDSGATRMWAVSPSASDYSDRTTGS
jgi:uncharacterized protein (TIGR02118 family)